MKSPTAMSGRHSLQRVVVVPGYGAVPDDHWFPWLRAELEARAVRADVVGMPSPQAPVASEWERAVGRALARPDGGTWVVAHSLGVITTLRVLAALREPWRLGGLVMVSGFTEPLAALPELDDYLDREVAAESLIERIGTRAMIRSDADPLVPAAASDDLASRLRATLHVQVGAGHFLADEGVTELPAALDLLPRPHAR